MKRAAAVVSRGSILCLLLAAASCGSAPRETFDLASAGARPLTSSELRTTTAAVAVGAPGALELLDSDRIVIRGERGDLFYLAGAQWADVAPRLVQAKLVDTLNAVGVDAAYPGATARYRLETTLQRFEIDEGRQAAVVELSARLEDEGSGRRKGAAIFVGEVPADHTFGLYASRAIEAALQQAAAKLAGWTRRIAR